MSRASGCSASWPEGLPPAGLSARGSDLGALQGTRSMSPKAATKTPRRASWIAA